MSTKISKIYDDLHALMRDLFPEAEELINPYSVESQDNLSLKACWGIEIVSGNNTKKELCALTMQRGFTITLTRKILGGIMKTSGAAEARHVIEKALLEDLQTLAKHLQDDTYLKDKGFENAALVQYESDGGLEFIRTNQFDLIMIRAQVPITYAETIGG